MTELQQYKLAYELATADLSVFCSQAGGASTWYKWGSLDELRAAGLKQAADIIEWHDGMREERETDTGACCGYCIYKGHGQWDCEMGDRIFPLVEGDHCVACGKLLVAPKAATVAANKEGVE